MRKGNRKEKQYMELNKVLKTLEIDQEEVMRRFGNNESLLERFLIKFKDEPTFFKLKEAVANKNTEDIEITAHTLKGVSANFGMEKLRAVCDEMVRDIRNDKTDRLEELFKKAEEEYDRLIEGINELK